MSEEKPLCSHRGCESFVREGFVRNPDLCPEHYQLLVDTLKNPPSSGFLIVQFVKKKYGHILPEELRFSK